VNGRYAAEGTNLKSDAGGMKLKKLYAGDNAPDFTVPCVRCGEFTLSSETKECPILLYFYPANYGMMCTYYSEKMNEYIEDFEKLNIKVFHVNDASVENHEKWMERVSSEYDHISDIDQKVSRMYGMIVNDFEGPGSLTNRGFVLIDTKMMIRYVWRAALPPDIRDIGELIAELHEILS